MVLGSCQVSHEDSVNDTHDDHDNGHDNGNIDYDYHDIENDSDTIQLQY